MDILDYSVIAIYLITLLVIYLVCFVS